MDSWMSDESCCSQKTRVGMAVAWLVIHARARVGGVASLLHLRRITLHLLEGRVRQALGARGPASRDQLSIRAVQASDSRRHDAQVVTAALALLQPAAGHRARHVHTGRRADGAAHQNTGIAAGSRRWVATPGLPRQLPSSCGGANSLPAASARAVVVIGLKARACVRRDLVSFGMRARGLGHVGIPIMMAISKVFIVHDPKGLPQFGYAEFEEIAWP